MNLGLFEEVQNIFTSNRFLIVWFKIHSYYFKRFNLKSFIFNASYFYPSWLCGTFVESSDRLDDLITNSWNYCGFIGNLCLKHKILNFSNSIGSSQFYSSAQQSLSAISGGRHTAAIIPKSQVRTRGNGYISLQLRPYSTKLSSSNISYQFKNTFIVWIVLYIHMVL